MNEKMNSRILSKRGKRGDGNGEEGGAYAFYRLRGGADGGGKEKRRNEKKKKNSRTEGRLRFGVCVCFVFCESTSSRNVSLLY